MVKSIQEYRLNANTSQVSSAWKQNDNKTENKMPVSVTCDCTKYGREASVDTGTSKILKQNVSLVKKLLQPERQKFVQVYFNGSCGPSHGHHHLLTQSVCDLG